MLRGVVRHEMRAMTAIWQRYLGTLVVVAIVAANGCGQSSTGSGREPERQWWQHWSRRLGRTIRWWRRCGRLRRNDLYERPALRASELRRSAAPLPGASRRRPVSDGMDLPVVLPVERSPRARLPAAAVHASGSLLHHPPGIVLGRSELFLLAPRRLSRRRRVQPGEPWRSSMRVGVIALRLRLFTSFRWVSWHAKRPRAPSSWRRPRA